MMLVDLYARNFRYCSHCSEWVEPDAEVYSGNDTSKRPLCPECRRALKIQPRGSKAKERVMLYELVKTTKVLKGEEEKGLNPTKPKVALFPYISFSQLLLLLNWQKMAPTQ